MDLHVMHRRSGGFDVHAAGCTDVRRGVKAGQYDDVDDVVEQYETLREIVENLYDGHLHDDPSATWRDYLCEFRILPCARRLPGTASA